MSEQGQSQQPYLTSQTNPEKLFQPIFYKNRVKNLPRHKNKRSSQLGQSFANKNKNNNSSKDEAFHKTSSCLSNIQKYDFGCDLCNNSTYDISKGRFGGTKKMNESKSFMNNYEQNLFKKMTIHCVRAEKEFYQNNCQHLERQYNHIINKIQKQRKAKFFMQLKDKKLQNIKKERRRFSQDIKKERKISLQKEINHLESAKKAIIAQRANTQFSIQKKKRQNMQSASSQRLHQQEFHLKLQNSNLEQLRKKKYLYAKQKQAQQQRKHNIAKNKQLRKLQAKKQFRNRWLTQLEKSNIAKLRFKQKKQKIEINLKKALESYLQNQKKQKV